MTSYQERVVREKEELDERIRKLVVFLGTKMFFDLPVDEQKRLRRQELIMELYSDVLADRIAAFPRN